MKAVLKFLGHGGAFSDLKNGNSNACLNVNGKNLLIDFGMCSNFVWTEEWKMSYGKVDALFISHAHFLDHCTIETLLFHRYFLPRLDSHGAKVKPLLFAAPVVLQEIWDGLKPSMQVYSNELLHITNFAECHACSDFEFEGIRFTLIRNEHIKSSFGSKDAYGLTFVINGVKVYWSSDSCGINKKAVAWADVIFHDCETLDGYKSGVHVHYNDLNKLPVSIKNKMHLMHYAPNGLIPTDDGFAGFVTKNQEFIF